MSEQGGPVHPVAFPTGTLEKSMVLLAPWADVDSVKVAEPEPGTKVLKLPALVKVSCPLPPMKVLLLPESPKV